MKKFLLLIAIVLCLTGCGKEEKKPIDMSFDDKYYDIMTPYKVGVGNNYIRPSVISTYDYSLVDAGLMDISVKYFDPDEFKFQAGQYLDEATLTDLLSDEKLNKTDTITVDGIKIKPNYISAIHEQNFLSSKSELGGISLALVLNPYQEYQNSNGTYLYKELSIDQTIEYGKQKSIELLKAIRKNKKLKETKIMIALYIIGNPNEISAGNFEYVGVTTDNEISFEKLDYQYQYLTSNYVLENDLDNYTAFGTLTKNIGKQVENLYIVAEGLYVNQNLNKIEIEVNSSLLTKDKLLMISQLFSEEIVKQFDDKLLIKVYIKINNETKALVVKKRNSLETNVYLLT